MIDLKGKQVLVTGGSSMIGKATIAALYKRYAVVVAPSRFECDLLNLHRTGDIVQQFRPDYVIHCAGWNGGIKFNQQYPAQIFQKTSLMALNILMACAEYKVKKVVSLISSCAYPDKGDIPLSESMMWDGLPNPSVECHGLSKRILHAYSRQLRKENNLNSVCAVLTNCYGIGDSFHPDKTKVVGAMIRRVLEAKEKNSPEIVCWGSGAPKRELMFSGDAGEAIVQVLEKCNDELINIGSDTEVSIKELTNIIAEIVEYKGDIIWDTTKIDGQMRKKLDTTKMHQVLDFKPVDIEYGLTETIQWYLNNRGIANARC